MRRYNFSGTTALRFDADWSGLVGLDKAECVVEVEVSRLLLRNCCTADHVLLLGAGCLVGLGKVECAINAQLRWSSFTLCLAVSNGARNHTLTDNARNHTHTGDGGADD